MDSMQSLAWVIFAGTVAVFVLVVVLLVMAVWAAAVRVRGHRSYHRMSPEERRAWRAAHPHHEMGDVRHA